MKKIFGLFLLVAITNTQIQAGDNAVALVSSTTPGAVILCSVSAIGFIGAAGCLGMYKHYLRIMQQGEKNFINSNRATYDRNPNERSVIYHRVAKNINAPKEYEEELTNAEELLELYNLEISCRNRQPGVQDLFEYGEKAAKLGIITEQEKNSLHFNEMRDRVLNYINKIPEKYHYINNIPKNIQDRNNKKMLSQLIQKKENAILAWQFSQTPLSKNIQQAQVQMKQRAKYSLGIGIVAALGFGLLRSAR